MKEENKNAGKNLVKEETQIASGKAVKRKIAIPLSELIKRVNKEPKLPMVWSGIKENSFGLIVGPSKSCKTILCENMGMSIASGAKEFLGLPLNITNRKVLFISLEEFYSNRTERNIIQIEKLTAINGSDWLANYTVVNEDAPRYVTSEKEWNIISDIIREEKPGVVFLDSLSRLYEGSIEDSKVAKAVCEKLREMTNELKITLIVIHHTHKLESGQPLTIHTIAGSRILSQESDFMIGMNKTIDKQCYIKDVAFRYADDNNENIKVFNLDKFLWINLIKEASEKSILSAYDGRKDDVNTTAVRNFIRQKDIAGETTYSSNLYKEFVTPKKMSKQTLFNQLDKLQDEGVIAKLNRGEYKFISKTE